MWLNYNKGSYIKTPNQPLPEHFMKALDMLIKNLSWKGSTENHMAENNITLKVPMQTPHEMVAIKSYKRAHLIEDVFNASLKDMDEAYKMGLKHGSNLLMQLQSGDLSMNDFNEILKSKTSDSLKKI